MGRAFDRFLDWQEFKDTSMTRTIFMLRNVTFGALALLLAAATAQAGMVVSVERMVNPGSAAAPYTGFTNSAFTTDTGFNSGTPQQTWVAYALGVIPSGGEKVTTFDITITTPLSGSSGFAQRWTLDADDASAPAIPTPSNAAVNTADSHLIVGGSIQFVSPTENQFSAGGPPVPANTATRQYGVGTSMVGAWGFTPAEQALQADGTPVRFGYIVVPRDAPLPNLVITANVAASNTAAGYAFTSANFLPLFPSAPIVPEPATFTLIGLAVSGLGFIRRR